MALIWLNALEGADHSTALSELFRYDDSWSAISASSTVITVSNGIRNDFVGGVGFGSDAQDNLTGTVQSWSAWDIASGRELASMSGLSEPLSTFDSALEFHTEAQLLARMLSGADEIHGSDASDVLDGLAGADTMYGGGGSDTFYVDHSGDKTIEYTDSGTDTVRSKAASYTLGANVENAWIDLTGSASLTGNSIANTIHAGAGNNVIDGLGGVDTVTYAEAGAAVKVSLSITTAQATGGSGSETLRNVENLVGSTFNDTLTGNSGANRLDGGAGADHLAGGSGDDTYVLDNAGDVVSESSSTGGIDTVLARLSNYTLGANVENGTVTLTGAATLVGNELDNRLGSGVANTTLDGGAGSDTADYASATKGVVVSLAVSGPQATGGSGQDTLVSIQNLAGSRYADTLTGNSAANRLNGGAGADTLRGGNGNDTYVVDDAGDVVAESSSSGGTDTVETWLNVYRLPDYVERGVILADGYAELWGNSLSNVLSAGAGDNLFEGGEGSDTVDYSRSAAAVDVNLYLVSRQETGGSGEDEFHDIENLIGSDFNDTLRGYGRENTLTGGKGSDTLTGYEGTDRFVLSSLVGSDTVTDFLSGTDKMVVKMSGIAIGDGDTTVEGAVTRSAPGGFSTAAELVVFTGNIAGSITSGAAAATIGSAKSAYAAGDQVLFAVDNGSSSALYLFTSAGADALVSASELKLLATLADTPSTSTADYLFAG